MSLNKNQIDNFFSALKKAISKKIEKLLLIPLHGRTYEFKTINELKSFIHKYNGDTEKLPLIKYEVFVKYTNGSEIKSQFKEKEEIFIFLEYITSTLAMY